LVVVLDLALVVLDLVELVLLVVVLDLDLVELGLVELVLVALAQEPEN
jgi:hypothetical protein